MNCPNCGAQVPPGDLFCGECGTRVMPEEKPSPPPSTAPAAQKGLPRGLLIGCGGLLALAVVVGCIFGAIELLGGEETPTPSPTAVAVLATPTRTPTSPADTPTPVPPTATPTQAAPGFELIASAPELTDDNEPIDPGTTFPPGTTHIYTVFDFSGMQNGVTYEAYWYRDGQEDVHETWEWDQGTEGTSFVYLYNDEGVVPGDYELRLFVEEQLLLTETFSVQADFAATVSNLRFAHSETDDDQPLGIGTVFPYGITEIYAFFDYDGFDRVEEIESIWLRDGSTEASGPLEWWGEASGTERIRLYDEEPLLAGNYEWQMRVAETDLIGGRFSIVEPLLFDDFEDPTTGWAESEDETSVQGYQDGGYSIRVTAPDLAVWATAGYTLDDFTLQTKVRQTEGDPANEAGLLFRYVDNANFYSLDVTGDGKFALFKLEDQEWSALVNWRESPHINPLGETNLLKVTCQGNRITLYANGHELASVTDDTFAQGDVGLFAGTFDEPLVEAVFDDFWALE
jgi:hypothetical protein